jgi:hypothetical protein
MAKQNAKKEHPTENGTRQAPFKAEMLPAWAHRRNSIDVLEHQAGYYCLAAAMIANNRPQTNFELEFVAWLLSLVWWLCRAVAITLLY